MGRLVSCKDKVIVVTGASRGIGRLMAIRAGADGGRVALVARDRERLEGVKAEIEAAGGTAHVIVCDLSDPSAVFSAAAAIMDTVGSVDVLVNNAGYGGRGGFLEWDADDMRRMLDVNVLASMYWTKALLPAMVERQRGWIVFMASVAGKIGVPDESVYCATKFALVGLAEALTIEVKDQGVHVLTVCPGTVNTGFFTDAMLARMPATAKRIMIEPERVVAETFKALAKEKHEITVPRSIAMGYLTKAIAPGFMRHMVKRVAFGRNANTPGG